eukprot:TRINITY_DN8399_c0_g4_i1.p1 TRINITY_DN8399_c0_g4~~TRINITY_DN8399_c0_g4_i1.p1  ORF type:complete len:282 (+),score=98.02 TRINITY_DN8399_c0_g4_i1:84-929(+)
MASANAGTAFVEDLARFTTERNALKYVWALEEQSLRSLADVVALTEDAFSELCLTPHLRQVLRRARGEQRHVFEGTPVDGYVVSKMVDPANIAYVIPLLAVMNYMVGMGSLLGMVERMCAMCVLCAVLAVLLVRSFYVHLHEEEIGRLEVTRAHPDDLEFTVTITTVKDGAVSEPVTAHTKGQDVGVLVHEVLLHPLLNFVGLSSRLSWTAVLGVDMTSNEQHVAHEISSVSTATWRNLELLPFIPGIRAIQRNLIMKAAAENSRYRVRKSISGQTWLQPY